jgi:hypothetical protein
LSIGININVKPSDVQRFQILRVFSELQVKLSSIFVERTVTVGLLALDSLDEVAFCWTVTVDGDATSKGHFKSPPNTHTYNMASGIYEDGFFLLTAVVVSVAGAVALDGRLLNRGAGADTAESHVVHTDRLDQLMKPDISDKVFKQQLRMEKATLIGGSSVRCMARDSVHLLD